VSPHPVLLYLPDPVGWIVIAPDALVTAQAAASEVLGATATNQTWAARGSATALLTAKDAAGLLGVEPSWLLRQAREGRIDHVRIGKYVRFQPTAIIEQCTRRATAADMTVSAIGCAGHKRI
jgi:excisionase family DNA binding protein